MKSLLGTYRRSDVIFRADGRFDLTAGVVRALGIKAGDVIDIVTDDTEYYICVVRHAGILCGRRFEAQVFPSSKRGSHFRGFSRRLCRSVLDIAGADTKAALPCGQLTFDTDGTPILPLIIKHNLAQQNN